MFLKNENKGSESLAGRKLKELEMYVRFMIVLTRCEHYDIQENYFFFVFDL